MERHGGGRSVDQNGRGDVGVADSVAGGGSGGDRRDDGAEAGGQNDNGLAGLGGTGGDAGGGCQRAIGIDGDGLSSSVSNTEDSGLHGANGGGQFGKRGPVHRGHQVRGTRWHRPGNLEVDLGAGDK